MARLAPAWEFLAPPASPDKICSFSRIPVITLRFLLLTVHENDGRASHRLLPGLVPGEHGRVGLEQRCPGRHSQSEWHLCAQQRLYHFPLSAGFRGVGRHAELLPECVFQPSEHSCPLYQPGVHDQLSALHSAVGSP